MCLLTTNEVYRLLAMSAAIYATFTSESFYRYIYPEEHKMEGTGTCTHDTLLLWRPSLSNMS